MAIRKGKQVKFFNTYDVEAFKKVFYSKWLTVDKHSATENFKLTQSTVELLDLLDEVKTASETFYDPRITKLGRLRVDGDKTLHVLSVCAEMAVKKAITGVRTEKDKALFAFYCAESKLQQDVALNALLDKMAEESALKLAVKASKTTKKLLTKEERKDILKEYKQAIRERKVSKKDEGRVQ